MPWPSSSSCSWLPDLGENLPAGRARGLIPNVMRQRVLAAGDRPDRAPSAVSRVISLSGWPKTSCGPTSLSTSRSQPLRASLARPSSSSVSPARGVSAAKPTRTWRGSVRAATRPASTSVVCTSVSSSPPSAGLLDLGLAGAGRGEVGRRRRHHRRCRRPWPPPPWPAARSAVEVTALDLGAGRGGQPDIGRDQADLGTAQHGGPGQRPAHQAGGGVAEEADRVQVLAGAAGADRDLEAGQVLAGRPGRDARVGQHRDGDREQLGGVGQPSRSGVRPGQPAGVGSTTTAPRLAERGRRWPGWRRAATSRCAWPGRRQPGSARSAARWSAGRRPGRSAARASRSAVAGATKTRSASWPILTCGTRCASSNTEVCTGRPDSAAQVPRRRTPAPPQWAPR